MQTDRNALTEGVIWKKLLFFALPILLGNIFQQMYNTVDTIIVGRLVGTEALAAVGATGPLVSMVNGFFIGVSSGATVVLSQAYGAGDRKGVSDSIHTGVALSLLLGVMLTAIGICLGGRVMGWMGTPENCMADATTYLRIYFAGSIGTVVYNMGAGILRAMGDSKRPMLFLMVTCILNVVLDLLFVAVLHMGVAGAACATLIARCIELILVLGYVYGKKLALACGPRGMFGWSKSFVFRFVETSAPVIANEFMWGLGTTMYSLAYGRMGDDAVAAITIATTIQDIAVVLFQGLSAATAVILGHELGAGHIKQAEKYATQFFILQFLVTVTADILLVLGRWKIIGIYNITPQVAQDVNRCLLVFALYMPAKMFNYVNVVGVLRSGGDTKMCLFLDTSGVWFLGVPLAFLGAFLWNLPIYGVYALVLTEEIYKAILGYLRYRQKKWLKNLAVQV